MRVNSRENSFFKKLLKSDLQDKNPLYLLISVYLGIILFVLNVVLMNVFSLSDIAEKWKNNCSEKISIEIPDQVASNENILKIKNLILDFDNSIKFSIIEKNKMIETVNKYVKDENFGSIPFPCIIEVKNFKKRLDMDLFLSYLYEISSEIKIHDHSKIFNPAVKISNFVEESYYVITALIICSLLIFIFIYCYQNIMINKENIYILTMLCAEREYIFKQVKIHLLLYFLVSFFIAIFLSGGFLLYLLGAHSGISINISTNLAIIGSIPVLVFIVLLAATKYTTYFVIKRMSFDCF